MGGLLPKKLNSFGGPLYDPLRDAAFGKKDNSQAQAIDSLPVPLPASPITSANAEVVQAEHDYARAQLAKKSVKSSVYAGETGGYRGPKMGMLGPLG